VNVTTKEKEQLYTLQEAEKELHNKLKETYKEEVKKELEDEVSARIKKEQFEK
jgi:hypothetical protein